MNSNDTISVGVDEIRCIVCACTESLPCANQNTPTGTCFWTWYDDNRKEGLCSGCASTPLGELERRLNGVRI